MEEKLSAVAHIRSFNRFYTRILGLLNQHILDSNFSLTEARVLLEISKAASCTANELADRLAMDHSYMSRIIKRFEAKKLITKTQSPGDNRFQPIALTDAGRAAIADLNHRSEAQVFDLIQHMSPEELTILQNAMALIRLRFSEAVFPVTLRNFTEQDLEYIIRRHAEQYQQEFHLSPVFAGYVDQGVRRLVQNFDPQKELILIPEINGQPMGSIAIARFNDQTAQLRYFLLEPEARGHGLGYRMVEAALDFCRKAGYTHVFLETISILTTARTIYQNFGFQITHTHENPQWGRDILEERWDLDL